MERGTIRKTCRDGCPHRLLIRCVDQRKPIAGACSRTRWMIGERSGKRGIAFDQMHGDDAVELFWIERIPKLSAQLLFASGRRAKANDSERRAAAVAAADRD